MAWAVLKERLVEKLFGALNSYKILFATQPTFCQGPLAFRPYLTISLAFAAVAES